MADEIQNTRVPVIFPDGDIGTMDQSELPNAELHGYRAALPEEVEHEKKRLKYGTGLDNQIKAAAQGLAESLPFVGGLVEKAAGLTPEAKKAREEFYPGTTGTFNALGAIAQMAVPVVSGPAKAISLAGKATEAASLSRLAAPLAKGVGSLVEGGLIGLGTVVNEAELGDTNGIGERVAVAVGTGAVIGGITGTFLGSVKSLIDSRAAKNAIKSGAATISKDEMRAAEVAAIKETTEKATSETTERLTGIPDGAPASGAMPFEDAHGLDYETLLGEIDKIDPKLLNGTNVKKEAFLEMRDVAKNRLKVPIQNIQIEALGDRATDQFLKTAELTGKGKKLAQLKAAQKADMINGMKEIISEVAPGHMPSTDPVEAGNLFKDTAKAIYAKGKEESKEFYEKFGSLAGSKSAVSTDLIKEAEDALPGITGLMNVDAETGKITLSKLTSDTGISPKLYKHAKNLFEQINNDKISLRQLENFRSVAWEDVDKVTNEKVSAGINRLRKAVLNTIVKTTDSLDIPLDFKAGLKNHAINEQKRETFNKMIGSLSEYAKLGESKTPEDVLKSVFRNSEFVTAAQDILGDDFDKHLSNYLAVGMEAATDKVTGNFSAAKFESFLNKKDSALVAAFSKKPQLLNELSAVSGLTKLIPDAAPANPPNTAETMTFLKRLAGADGAMGAVKEAGKMGYEFIKKGSEEKHMIETFNELQKMKAMEEVKKSQENFMSKYINMRAIEYAADKTQKQISSAVNSIARYDGSIQAVSQIGLRLTKEQRDKEFNKVTSDIKDMVANPSILQERVMNGAKDIAAHAPNIANSIQFTAVRQADFLRSKLPQEPQQAAFSPKWEASELEKAQFMHYYRATKDPLVALHDIKSGTLTKQTVEAVASTVPELYNSMKTELLNRVTSSKKAIPYRTQMMISLFVDAPLSNSLTPQSILGNQTSLNAPSLKNQENVAAPRPNAKGMDNLDQADRMLTPMQKANQRKE